MKRLISMLLIVCMFIFLPVSTVAYAKDEGTKVVVLMYHGVVKDKNRRDTYVIDNLELEKDIKYLQKSGYEIVTTSDLLSVTKGKMRPHQKYAVLTFDDGFYGNFKYGLPLFEKYNVSAVFAVVGKYASNKIYTDKSSVFAYMDWEDISKISNKVEIASHSYDMHNLKGRKGVGKRKGESDSAYLKCITEDFEKNDLLITKHSSKPLTFAYPYGIYNKTTEMLLEKMGYKITLTCNEGINYIKTENDLKLLKRINRDGRLSSSEFMKKYKI